MTLNQRLSCLPQPWDDLAGGVPLRHDRRHLQFLWHLLLHLLLSLFQLLPVKHELSILYQRPSEMDEWTGIKVLDQNEQDLLRHELINRSVWINLKLPCPKHLQGTLSLDVCWQRKPLCGLCLEAWEGAAAFRDQRKVFPSSIVVLPQHCYRILVVDQIDAQVASAGGGKWIEIETLLAGCFCCASTRSENTIDFDSCDILESLRTLQMLPSSHVTHHSSWGDGTVQQFSLL